MFLHYIFDLEEIIFENFNISENNIISVKLAKVLRYCPAKPRWEIGRTSSSSNQKRMQMGKWAVVYPIGNNRNCL
jgi:hypothetical protein